MRKPVLKKFGNVIYPVISLAVLMGLWAVVAAAADMELIIPSVKTTFLELFSLLGDSAFYRAVGGTLARILVSFACGAAAALIFSLLSLFEPVERLLSPIIKIVRSIPTMSVILLTVIWMNPSASPIFIAFLIIFPIMYSGFYSALTGVDGKLYEMSKAYGVSKKDMALSLYLPSVAPAAFDCMQASISLTVKLIISAEVLAQTRGSIGIMMQTARGYLETALLLAWTLTAVFLSYLSEAVVFGIKKAVVRRK